MCEAIKAKKGRVPDCEACTPPLMPENFDAMRVFTVCQGQVLVAPMGGAYAMNHMAIHEAMRLYGVADPQDCFEKVLLLARELLFKGAGSEE